MNSTRIITSYWPLALLKSKLGLENSPLGAELAVLNSPCFALVDEDGVSKVAYHSPVLQCFERVHSRGMTLPINRTWPRLSHNAAHPL